MAVFVGFYLPNQLSKAFRTYVANGNQNTRRVASAATTDELSHILMAVATHDSAIRIWASSIMNPLGKTEIPQQYQENHTVEPSRTAMRA